jgi:hypothetical protein
MLPTMFGSVAGASSLVVKAKLIFRANRAPIQIRQPSPSQTVLNITPHPESCTHPAGRLLSQAQQGVMQLSAFPLPPNKQCYWNGRSRFVGVRSSRSRTCPNLLPLQRVDQVFHCCVLRSAIRSLTIDNRGARDPDSGSLFAFRALRQGIRPPQYGPNGYVKEPSGRSPDGSFPQLPVR